MKPEFEVGQEITFKPYEKECKCIIKGINTENKFLNGDKDHRVHYEISGDARSQTTGESIMESRYFIPWENHPDYKNIIKYDPDFS